jgi:hypothetical protein
MSVWNPESANLDFESSEVQIPWKKKIICTEPCIANVLGEYMKTNILNRLSRGVAGVAGLAVRAVVEICDLRFRLPFVTWARLMHPILRILKFWEQTQESKNFKISFEFFVKMLDGINFGKKWLLWWSIWYFWILLENWSKICLSPSE